MKRLLPLLVIVTLGHGCSCAMSHGEDAGFDATSGGDSGRDAGPLPDAGNPDGARGDAGPRCDLTSILASRPALTGSCTSGADATCATWASGYAAAGTTAHAVCEDPARLGGTCNWGDHTEGSYTGDSGPVAICGSTEACAFPEYCVSDPPGSAPRCARLPCAM